MRIPLTLAILLPLAAHGAVPTVSEVAPAAVRIDAMTRVTVSGTGFVEGSWVEIEPGGLHVQGGISTQGVIWDSCLRGDLVGAALAQPNRVEIWSVADPQQPVRLGTLPVGGVPVTVAWVGDFLLVGLDTGSLLSVDVRDPAAPAAAGTRPGSGRPRMVLSGSRLFVVRSGSGVEILDVSAPASPILLGAISDVTTRPAVAVEANRLYFGNGAGVQIWDATDPSAPARLGEVPAAQVSHIAVRENRLIDAAPGFGLNMRLVDVSDPAAPVELVPRRTTNSVPVLWNDAGLLAWHYWYEHGVHSLLLLDQETLAPLRMLSMDPSISYGPIQTDGARGLSGGVLFGMDPLLGPVRGTQVPVPFYSYLYQPVVAEDRLYWRGWDSLRLFDMTDPLQPTLLGSTFLPHLGGTLAADGSRAFVRYEEAVRVLDVSDASAPALLGSCPASDFKPTFVEGGVAYGAGWTGTGYRWMACDARGPGAPTLVSGPEMAGDWIARTGSRLFGWDASRGLLVLDAGNPLEPVEIGSAFHGFPDDYVHANAVVHFADRVYVATDPPMGLLSFDVSDPAAPTRLGFLALPYSIQDLREAGGALYGSNAWPPAVLIGFDLSDPDHPRVASRQMPFGFPAHQSFTFTAAGSWIVAGSALAEESPYFAVFRPNPTIRNFVRESGSRISFDVPPGWDTGNYHVRVVQPDGTSRTAFHALTACERSTVEAALALAPGHPQRWRIGSAGARSAALRLPPIPSDAEVVSQLDEAPDRFELTLRSDGAVQSVRLKGPDPIALQQTWETVRGAGGIPWPQLGNGTFGDVDLSVRTRGRGFRTDLVYTLVDGRLQRATSNRGDLDLVTELRGDGEGACTAQTELSYLEALASLCEASPCPGNVPRRPVLERAPTGPVPFGR
jgi:hypothetical protein